MDSENHRSRVRLPLPLTSLLGREDELAEIVDLLRLPDARLVTISGPSGVGKTRLAVAVAWRLTEAFDVAAFVSLAPIRDAALVMPAIAQELGAPEDRKRSPMQSASARLQGSSVLLVLDNLEHLPLAAPEIAELLAASPGLKVLATSRSSLQIRGERPYPLPCLPLPDRSPTAHAAALAANPAVALFVERAREVDPDFVQTEENAAPIAEICRELEGLPLAIELAAARIKLLSPEALLARLDRRLALLTDGPRDLPDRQRTLRAAIAWSYDLLSPPEQRLFARLAVFAGHIELRAAEIVAEGDDENVVDQFSSLVNKNMLQRVAGPNGEPRFIMLETLREFGLAMLAETHQMDAARERHAAYCLALAQAAVPHMYGGARSSWLRRLDVDRDNLRTALDWLIQQRQAELALTLAGSLWQFWWWRSYLADGRRLLEAALALPGAEAPSLARAMALTGAGALAETLGDDAAAEVRYEEALACWTETGDERGRGITLLFRWLLAFNAENHDRMQALAAESLAFFRRLGDDWGVAMSTMELGIGFMRRRDVAAAARELQQGLALFRRVGDVWGAALCQGALGNVHLERQEYDQAARLIRASLEELLLNDDRWGIATILSAAAHLAMERREFERAVCNSAAAVSLHDALRTSLKPPFRPLFERNLESARAAMGDAAFAAAWLAGQSRSLAEIVEQAVADDGGPSRAAVAGVLTTRELDVLRLAAKLRTDPQIGDELFISKRTVNRHIEHILGKLDVNTRHEAAAAARALGIL
jgi:predicted ATPase/DNA-binding CsgD family transcriptional regulator